MNFFPRIRALFQRRRLEAEMAEEMRLHREQRIEEHVAAGMSPDEARFAVQREFGHLDGLMEECRDGRGWVWLEQLFQDARHVLRSLARNPVFTLFALLTLGLALGATTAIFSIADAVLFRPLPFAESDRVQVIMMMNRKTGQRSTQIDAGLVKAIQAQRPGVLGIGTVTGATGPVVASSSGAERIQAVAVSSNYFSLLGVRPVRGRIFSEADGSQPGRPAMLSYGAWRNRFDGDEGLVGSSAELGGQHFDIVGILPEDLVLPRVTPVTAANPELFTLIPPPVGEDDMGPALTPIVRLAAGVTPPQAEERIAVLARQASVNPAVIAGDSVPVFADVRQMVYPTGRPAISLLLAASVIVVLIGCANLAQMLGVKQRRRAHETGIRAALGAGRARLARLFVLEGIILGLAGSVLALVITALTFNALSRQVPAGIIRGPAGVDHRVALFVLGFGLAAGLAVAVFPAWAETRMTLVPARHAGRRPRRFGTPLIALQIALTLLLLFGTAAVSRAFVAVLNTPLGFSPENVLLISGLQPPAGTTGPAVQEFQRRALAALAGQPEVTAVGASGWMPLGNRAPDDGIAVDGIRQPQVGVGYQLPGFFETAGVRLISGRFPTSADVQSGPGVAVLAEKAARLLFPNQSPLGQSVTTPRGRSFPVVGVVADVLGSFQENDRAQIYVASGGVTVTAPTFLVRLRAHREDLRLELARAARDLSPNVPVTAQWWTDTLGGVANYRNPRFQLLILGSFSLLGLVLAAVGIFAVVGYLVAIREREFGVRLAVGSTPGALTWLVLRQTLQPVAVGLIGGLVATSWAGRLVENYLGIPPARDFGTVGITCAVIVVTAVIAAWLPARRAARVDPMTALRSE